MPQHSGRLSSFPTRSASSTLSRKEWVRWADAFGSEELDGRIDVLHPDGVEMGVEGVRGTSASAKYFATGSAALAGSLGRSEQRTSARHKPARIGTYRSVETSSSPSDNRGQERSDARRIAGREDVGVIVSWWSPLGGDCFGTVQVLGSGLTHLTG